MHSASSSAANGNVISTIKDEMWKLYGKEKMFRTVWCFWFERRLGRIWPGKLKIVQGLIFWLYDLAGGVFVTLVHHS